MVKINLPSQHLLAILSYPPYIGHSLTKLILGLEEDTKMYIAITFKLVSFSIREK